jgi:hypothetical protein
MPIGRDKSDLYAHPPPFLGIEHLVGRFSLMKPCKFIACWQKREKTVLIFRS